jgi:hypothetical protein
VRRYDDVEDLHPTVWAPDNQIIISVGNIDIFRLVLDARGRLPHRPDTGDRIDSGPAPAPSVS